MPWQDVRPSVRLSVCHTPVLCLNDYTNSQKVFLPSGSPTILVFPYQTRWQYSDGNPLNRGVECKGMKKSRFSTNILLCLANDARSNHSYYGRSIGNRTQAFEWYRLNDREWPLTQISRSWYHSTSNNSKTVADRAIFTMADQ